VAAAMAMVPATMDEGSDAGSVAASSSPAASSLHRADSVISGVALRTRAQTPAYHFCCSKCKKDIPMSQMSSTRHGVCKVDDLSYKQLALRWSKDRALKTWWDKKDEVGRTEWYHRQQQFVQAGEKRKFETISYEDESKKISASNERDQDLYQPFDEWSLHGLLKGKSPAALEKEWTDLVNDSTTEAIWRRGMWLIPRFVGILRERVTGDEQSSSSKRMANIETAEQLQQLQHAGKALLEAHAATIQPAGQNYGAQPACLAELADQPLRHPPTDIMGQQINREAIFMYSSSG
jgi:hypothetical protein